MLETVLSPGVERSKLISTDDALELVLEKAPIPKIVVVPLDQAGGEVLQEDLLADRDFPPYNRVAMDGIAIASAGWKKGCRSFQINGIQASGTEPLQLIRHDTCFEIMTGASLSKGCDAVVRYEDVQLTNGNAEIDKDIEVRPWLNIHRRGLDQKAGDLIIKKGCVLRAPQIAVAASIGKAVIQVAARPRIAILSTGDELVDVNHHPEPYQIRASNSQALDAALRIAGNPPTSISRSGDDRELLKAKMEDELSDTDILIITGGVSRGKYDHIPDLLKECGVEKAFHRVAQKPGKPLWFGVHSNGAAVFALPGNPVAVLICFHKYILPYLHACSGRNVEIRAKVRLTSPLHPKGELTHFIPITLAQGDKGEKLGRPVSNNGSGDLTSLARSDGFVELQNKDFSADPQILDWYSWDGLSGER